LKPSDTNELNSKGLIVVDLRFTNPCWHEEIRDRQLQMGCNNVFLNNFGLADSFKILRSV